MLNHQREQTEELLILTEFLILIFVEKVWLKAQLISKGSMYMEHKIFWQEACNAISYAPNHFQHSLYIINKNKMPERLPILTAAQPPWMHCGYYWAWIMSGQVTGWSLKAHPPSLVHPFQPVHPPNLPSPAGTSLHSMLESECKQLLCTWDQNPGKSHVLFNNFA